MSSTVKFLVLYLIPIFTACGTLGTFMFAHGKSANSFIKFIFMVVSLGLISTCYITITLIIHFLSDGVFYSGVVFTILGCLFEFVTFGFFIVMFKDELRAFR